MRKKMCFGVVCAVALVAGAAWIGPTMAQETTRETTADDQLSPELTVLREKLRRCLDTYYRRAVSVESNDCWDVMHWTIGYGVDTRLVHRGKYVNAAGWLCWNNPCKGYRIMTLEGGKPKAKEGWGGQGHPAQFLSILANSRVKPTYTLRVGGQEFTVKDLIAYELRTCRPNSELSFKLISVAYYLPSDAMWKDQNGRDWSTSRLIKEELAHPIIGATCGGTHRLMGFCHAVKKRMAEGKPIDGQWKRAKKYVEDYHKYTFKLQNSDGSFSTDHSRGRGASPDVGLRLETTGHTMEWMAYSLPNGPLTGPRMTKAVHYLVDLMLKHPARRWEIGPLGHAIHALVIYDERVFGAKAGDRRAAAVTTAKARGQAKAAQENKAADESA